MEFMGKLFIDLLNNNVLLVAMLSWLVSQVIKAFLNAIITRKFSIERLFGDGGMPSGHSATVTSAAAMCAWTYGFDSAVFGIACVLAIVVMHDATGVRREAGRHAVAINEIVEKMDMGDDDITIARLKEFVGHTHKQVIVGCLLGIVMTVLFCSLTGIGYLDGHPTAIVTGF